MSFEKDEKLTARHVHPNIVCKNCVLAKGPAPFADDPEKSYCKHYSGGEAGAKPNSVYFDGEECEFHLTKAEAEKAVEVLEEERRRFHEQRAKERAKGGE
jgi:hypothetical protein